MTDGTFQWLDFGAGWFSGICGLLVGHPLDTIKVKQQTSEVRRNAFKVAHAVLKSEGPIGFYRGLFMPLLSAGVLNSVFFGTYGNTLRFCANYRDEKFKRTCCDTLNNVPTYKYFHWDVFLAGCVAGTFTTVGLCPFELAKIKLQTQYEQLKKFKMKDKNFVKYSGSFDCLTKLFKAGGFKYIFKGLVPMIWRDVPTYGLYTLVYEHTICLCEYNSEYKSTAPVCIVLGGSLAVYSVKIPSLELLNVLLSLIMPGLAHTSMAFYKYVRLIMTKYFSSKCNNVCFLFKMRCSVLVLLSVLLLITVILVFLQVVIIFFVKLKSVFLNISMHTKLLNIFCLL
ncbi:solute carrier family 25 member 45-like isoform X4 [Lycorma delicatula]|uniref:solute carrier family 25 member 45-like isoform X4 n=1 Tax=Lycorma delicatula TaxID=130591 RepID=UPI003F518537